MDSVFFLTQLEKSIKKMAGFAFSSAASPENGL
jgi:hypothetical protein